MDRGTPTSSTDTSRTLSAPIVEPEQASVHSHKLDAGIHTAMETPRDPVTEIEEDVAASEKHVSDDDVDAHVGEDVNVFDVDADDDDVAVNDVKDEI